jgi:hypothetical protein
MKSARKNFRNCAGNTLVISVVFCGIIALVLMTYLELVQARTKVRARSQSWNTAIPVLEAGIEEAFTHLKDDTNMTSNGWSSSGSGSTITYQKIRTNSDGSYYVVTISNRSTIPIIYSQGFVPAPLKQGYISRRVMVTCATAGNSLFSKAILSRSTINFAGDMQINSYDSSNTNYSNPDGTYNTNKTLANGWIAAMASSGQAIDIAGAKIYGGIQYPGTATYNIGSGEVGDTAYVNNGANSGTIEAGYSDNTLNVTIPPTPMPTNALGSAVDPSTWPPLVLVTTNIGGTTYNLIPNGDWSIGNSTTFFHNANIMALGNARLYVGSGGKIVMGSGYSIKIPIGSSLNIYNDSTTDAVFTGISNDSQLATKFYYWGLPDTAGSKLTLTGGGFFAGAIYAYYQDVVLTGGSSGNIRDFYGALVANSVVNSGHFYMAYDQALGFTGAAIPTTLSWLEL